MQDGIDPACALHVDPVSVHIDLPLLGDPEAPPRAVLRLELRIARISSEEGLEG